MGLMRSTFRSFRGRPWWYWRNVAERRERANGQLPRLPDGMVFVVDDQDQHVVGDDGNYVIAPA